LLKDFTPPENVPEPVMHQFTGAYIAANLFNIQDEDILNAIRYHTSGRENMSDLEKLIYISDMVEEGRNFDGVEEIRAAFETSLNSGMMSALTHQVNYLSKDNKKIYPLTMRAYEYMRKNNDK
jgi:predicted HD superfamily hydrolase involved in NAD metabolism